MTKRRVPLRENPDQPHNYQPRKITNHGGPWPEWWMEYAGAEDEFQRPCRHCGGSKSLPIHWLEVAR